MPRILPLKSCLKNGRRKSLDRRVRFKSSPSVHLFGLQSATRGPVPINSGISLDPSARMNSPFISGNYLLPTPTACYPTIPVTQTTMGCTPATMLSPLPWPINQHQTWSGPGGTHTFVPQGPSIPMGSPYPHQLQSFQNGPGCTPWPHTHQLSTPYAPPPQAMASWTPAPQAVPSFAPPAQAITTFTPGTFTTTLPPQGVATFVSAPQAVSTFTPAPPAPQAFFVPSQQAQVITSSPGPVLTCPPSALVGCSSVGLVEPQLHSSLSSTFQFIQWDMLCDPSDAKYKPCMASALGTNNLPMDDPAVSPSHAYQKFVLRIPHLDHMVTLWGGIPVKPSSCNSHITVRDVLTSIHQYMYTKISEDDEMYIEGRVPGKLEQGFNRRMQVSQNAASFEHQRGYVRIDAMGEWTKFLGLRPANMGMSPCGGQGRYYLDIESGC
ncbi:hypothetical protein PC9H_009745 [Pleurotus ostreatus]|uniref:DUF6699 domain-containing protein n=2 Tax=Pleurotus TaxID=5320 RepID=A0A8H7DQY9_PLEOS|nr:uncharacterized protein PC9H_009745 [Pleurotus ostreatus]KAF7424438.1 hypothetical protein PC9H_009745 [Pleurotus ostreatus]